jgi:squalene synthase HpnC
MSAPASTLPDPGAVMAQASSENFPVASRVLAPAMRRHLLAIYGFARLVDDTGDDAPGDRLALLDAIEADVDRVYRGAQPYSPLVRRLVPTVRICGIPRDPLGALIEANRRDQRQHSYATYEDLADYCALSANPVGHLVLYVFDAATPERLRLSDLVCTGLQLAEHCQDVSEDRARGRTYLPIEDLDRFGCTVADLDAPRADDRVRALIAFEVRRARALLDEGSALIATLRGRAAFAVAGFVAGGRAALGAIERAGHDGLAGAPRATRRARLVTLAATLAHARAGRRA